MPYLIETKTDDAARIACAAKPPFGPGVVGDIVKLEVWGSDFKDPGPDWCEFRITYSDSRQQVVRTEGY